ncbi:hypothetical protein EDC18_103305 [Natranaerovirga pectinivora]|uniref:Uncharacterized protein n=1 Tax=Natranaerovirga pectinivora TaxID=682400 RepID=A0A4R3MS22_9FIRM|nr:hypothetical protein [Natranaerovirga pectinivora]TCT15597.1 hypothetical protein EDC18_103305 [Natranaerovirga pectinivora]
MVNIKKRYVSILLISILVIAFFYHNYISSEFTMVSTAAFKKDSIKLNEEYYLGYSLKWEGIVKPTINYIELRMSDGTILSDNDKYLSVNVFIDESNNTGALKSESVAKYLPKYSNPENFRVKNNRITIVLNINRKKEDYMDVRKIMISYNLFGLEKKQTFDIYTIVP